VSKWKYHIGIVFFTAVLAVLFVLAKQRNNARKLTHKGVQFVGRENLFVSENFVNKMLKETPNKSGFLTKETLDLKLVEQRIEKQKHIEDAEVYVSVNGGLRAKVVQRTPIARVFSSVPFYIDAKGFEMPLSSNYATRVPLVYGYTKKHKVNLLSLLNYIRNDEFLKKLVIGIYCLPKNDFSLKLRDQKFTVKLGGIDNQKLKFENFKAFYAKLKKDKLFDKYKYVNLEITNQVICTKV